MFKQLNDLKNLPPKEFDAKLGELLKARQDAQLAHLRKAKPESKPPKQDKK